MADKKSMPVAEVAALFKIASERFGELSALLDVLRRQHRGNDDMFKLANLGRNVAADYEEQCGTWSEQVEDSGVAP